MFACKKFCADYRNQCSFRLSLCDDGQRSCAAATNNWFNDALRSKSDRLKRSDMRYLRAEHIKSFNRTIKMYFNMKNKINRPIDL